jgi:hypothetical protein
MVKAKNKTYTLDESKCPYCDILLSPAPKMKSKCKSCGNTFYVRTRSQDKKRVIVTEQGVKEIKEGWLEHSKVSTVFSSGIVTREEFEKAKSETPIRSDSDVMWGLFNKKLLDQMKLGKWAAMKMTYYEMAIFVIKEGKECFHLLQESSKCSLMDYKSMGTKKVSILTAGEGSCVNCLKLAKKKFTIEEALSTMPIPVKECETDVFGVEKGFCRCIYVPEIE